MRHLVGTPCRNECFAPVMLVNQQPRRGENVVVVASRFWILCRHRRLKRREILFHHLKRLVHVAQEFLGLLRGEARFRQSRNEGALLANAGGLFAHVARRHLRGIFQGPPHTHSEAQHPMSGKCPMRSISAAKNPVRLRARHPRDLFQDGRVRCTPAATSRRWFATQAPARFRVPKPVTFTGWVSGIVTSTPNPPSGC